MHILLANRWYPPHSGFGGVAMYNYYLSQALVHLGHQVTIVSARRQESDPKLSHNGRITVHRILQKHRPRLHRLPLLGRHVRFIQQISYSLNLSKTLTLLDRVDPFDLVEFADVNAEGWAYLHQSNRKPVVVRCHTPTFVLREYHTQDEMPYNTSWTARAEKSAILRADRLTAPSLDMARTISAHVSIPVSNISVIPNILDANAFASHSTESTISDEISVLHVGRLERIKGIGVLAEAIPLVLEQLPNTRFVFIGAARSDAASQFWTQRLKQAGGQQVTLLGFLRNSEMLEWYRKADIAVVPSLNYESFSYTVAQAMAAGVPIVASRIGGIPETMQGGGGLLFEPGDATACAAALMTLARDKNLRKQMGAAGTRRAKQEFHAEIVAQKMLEVYQNAITCSSTP